ncbi:hypothetical protein V1477_002160 [Vespula maculifrons]|uniref:Uncharacterized protein n=1 Tax=Vespula maculifrons TaxID=7453 RepID=A0ABD2CVU3_VESMC
MTFTTYNTQLYCNIDCAQSSHNLHRLINIVTVALRKMMKNLLYFYKSILINHHWLDINDK